ncbi:hypothetical protein B0H13DRAFT_2353247 [Mycena leptocephala]|nr:hypothetical protein B0H13DRAFT_2353247 [Mycena leptocephala]
MTNTPPTRLSVQPPADTTAPRDFSTEEKTLRVVVVSATEHRVRIRPRPSAPPDLQLTTRPSCSADKRVTHTQVWPARTNRLSSSASHQLPTNKLRQRPSPEYPSHLRNCHPTSPSPSPHHALPPWYAHSRDSRGRIRGLPPHTPPSQTQRRVAHPSDVPTSPVRNSVSTARSGLARSAAALATLCRGLRASTNSGVQVNSKP